MPGPSRTCAFGASSKAAHYSFKISLLLKIFLTALCKNPRSVLVISKVAFGKNPFNRIKLQTENDLWSLHLHQALRTIIQPEKGKQKYCLCCPVYLKGLKLELKVKAQQYFEGSFYMFEKKNEMFLSCMAFRVYDKSFASHVSCVDGLFTPWQKCFSWDVNKQTKQLTCDANGLKARKCWRHAREWPLLAGYWGTRSKSKAALLVASFSFCLPCRRLSEHSSKIETLPHHHLIILTIFFLAQMNKNTNL